MKLLALWEGMGGVEYHRLYSPLKFMQINYSEEVEVDICTDINDKGLPDLRGYDLVLFNRYIGVRHYDILVHLAKHNIPYIIDIDDHWQLPRFHHAYRWWKSNQIKAAITDAITYAHAVTTTTPLLADKIRVYNKNVTVIPNALNLTDDQWLAEPTTSDKVRFGWVGGLTHANDIQIICDSIADICESFPDKVEFYLCGYEQHHLWQSILYRFNGAADKIRPQIVVSQAQSVNEYGNFYRLFDVALAPLENTNWNNCKSELKIIEAAAYSLPVIASGYMPFLNHAGNVGVRMTLNSPTEWFQNIRWFIDNRDKAQVMGAANKEYCDIHHNFAALCRARLDFYRDCLQV